ncbi:MAG: RagB/SusD family nutrient uptake outer membrane protein [Marinifilum sp.]|jgi:hypothetical protein|nr:RagB/SusD family nutrient uptake outer membrane protein [Marinifilum sp.]
MKRYKNTILLLFLALSIASCDYLDIVPDDTPSLDDAFKRPAEAQNFLYSLYSFMPLENDMFEVIGLWGTDEMATPWDRSNYHAKRMMKGELNANDPFFDYWTTDGDIDLYDGIRQCYVFLENIDKVLGVTDELKTRWKGEAQFLCAYYHFILLRQYGPIVLIEKAVPLNADKELFFPKRKPYDECVQFIARLFDEAALKLPEIVSSPNEYGRVSGLMAKSLKARMYLYAASPLFNGNKEYYSNFKGVDGELLMSLNENNAKWQQAADLALEAIQDAESQGVQLYEHGAGADAQSNYRYMMVEPWNNELIWGYSKKEHFYGWQRHSAPREEGADAYNGQSPTLRIVETYLTKNGLPIDVDPEFDYNNRYDISGDIIKLHENREPRFYASVAYDRGNFEINGDTTIMEMKFEEKHGYLDSSNKLPTGYLVKKGVHPQTIITAAEDRIVNYPWPLIRLAELYLNYAEALNEAQGIGSHAKVIEYLDKIRKRSGIPGIKEAWQKVGKTAFTKEEMREIIRTERNIELAFEGHRCWDIRRWKLGDKYFNVPVQGWNVKGATAQEFYQVTNAETRVFDTPSYYLLPIRISELEINQNLVQNPGW